MTYDFFLLSMLAFDAMPGWLRRKKIPCPRCKQKAFIPALPTATQEMQVAIKSNSFSIEEKLRELKKLRKRISFREWCDERFTWAKGLTDEPLVFWLFLAIIFLFACAGEVAIVLSSGWTRSGSVNPLPVTGGVAIVSVAVLIFFLYRTEVARKEATLNATINDQIRTLKEILFERTTRMAEIQRIQTELKRTQDEEAASEREEAARQAAEMKRIQDEKAEREEAAFWSAELKRTQDQKSRNDGGNRRSNRRVISLGIAFLVLGFAALCLAIVVLFVANQPPNVANQPPNPERKVSRVNYDKIHSGMSVTEVQAILGPGSEAQPEPEPDQGWRVVGIEEVGRNARATAFNAGRKTALRWEEDGRSIQVFFLDGRAQEKQMTD
jgi:hypothetical protein